MYANASAASLSLILTILVLTQPTIAANGVPRIIDGDTLLIDGERIRLEGIDAPENDQQCLDGSSKTYACGIAARDALRARIGDRIIRCDSKGHDRYGRTLATCSEGGDNLNAWLVSEGWALAYVRYSKAYAVQETSARSAKKGLWSGAFIAPWDWRHADKTTEILGAVSVPISAQKILLNIAEAAEAPTGCAIKGNINRKGERIYHVPGSRDYGRTEIDLSSGERWFCSEGEAEAAGWRPPHSR